MTSTPDVQTENSVTIFFKRSVQVRQYEPIEASIFVQTSIPSDATPDERKAAIKAAFFEGKVAVYEQLGISFEVTQENVVIERLEKATGARVVEQAPTKQQATEERGNADITERVNARLDENDLDALWADLVANPSQWWDNRENKKTERSPEFKRKGRKGERTPGLWLNRKPASVEVPDASAFAGN